MSGVFINGSGPYHSFMIRQKNCGHLIIQRVLTNKLMTNFGNPAIKI